MYSFRRFKGLRTLGGIILAVLFLAGCGGGDSPTGTNDETEEPTYSFDAITGEWTGDVGRSDMEVLTDVTIDRSTAQEGDKVGSFSEWRGTERTDDRFLCSADLVVTQAPEPPTYWFDYVFTENVSCAQGTLRYEHDPDAETLAIFWKCEGCSDYNHSGTLTRKGN